MSNVLRNTGAITRGDKMSKTSRSYQKQLLEDLKDPTEAAAYLNAALEDESDEIFLLALRNVAEAHGISRLSRMTHLNRESMYKMLSDKGNPQLSSLSAILHSIGLKLVVEVSESASVTI